MSIKNYYHCDYQNTQFYLLTSQNKQWRALQVLQNIEYIIVNKLKNGAHPSWNEKEINADLLKAAYFVKKGFFKKSKKLNCVRRFFGRVKEKEKNILAACQRIKNAALKPPPIIPRIYPVVDHVLQYLPKKDLAHCAQLNRHGAKKVRSHMLSLAKNYGYPGNNRASDQSYMKELYTEVIALEKFYDDAFLQGSAFYDYFGFYPQGFSTVHIIKKKYFVYKGLFRHLNFAKTLDRLRSLSPRDIISLAPRSLPTLNSYFLDLVKKGVIKGDPNLALYFNQLLVKKVNLTPNEIELYVRLGGNATEHLLVLAITKNFKDLIDFLIQNKAPLGYGSLQVAVQSKDLGIFLKILLSCSQEQQNLLSFFIVTQKDINLLNFFLSHAIHPININFRSQGAKTLLEIAASNKDLPMMKKLIENGAERESVLHYIAQIGDIEMLKLLAEMSHISKKPLNVNILDSKGVSPLAIFLTSRFRTKENEQPFVNLLLSLGACTSLLFAFNFHHEQPSPLAII